MVCRLTRACERFRDFLLRQNFELFFSCLQFPQPCLDLLVVVFVVLQTHVANREAAECPLLDKLRNISTHNIAEGHFSHHLYFSDFHLSAVINPDTDHVEIFSQINIYKR